MAVDTSSPEAPPPPFALDTSKLTHAYRQAGAVSVPEVADGRRSPLATHMPQIEPLPSRFLQRLVRAEAERGRQRPPTPARPSLPQLEPVPPAPAAGPGWTARPAAERTARSRSEPRSAAQLTPSDDDKLEQISDLLDASVRSDGSGAGGWRAVRCWLGRQRTPTGGLTLPPIGAGGKHTPLQRMPRGETQRLLEQAKVNLLAMEGARPVPPVTHTAVTSSGP